MLWHGNECGKNKSNETFKTAIMIDQKHLENVECFKYLGSMLTDGGRCTVKLNVGLPWQKLHLTRERLCLLAHWA